MIQLLDRIAGDLAAPQPDKVQTVDARRMPVAGGKRRDILDNLGTAPDNRQHPHPHKLVDRHHTPNHRLVLDGNMPGQGAVIGQDAAAADPAVMGDMGIRHNQVMVAHYGLGPFGGAGIQSAIFTDDIIVADLEENLTVFEFKILGGCRLPPR